MKIEVKHSKERVLYDKLLFIASNIKGIKKGKVTKIKKITEYYKNLIIVGLSVSFLFILIYFITRHNLYLVCFAILLILSILLLFINRNINKNIDIYVNHDSDSLFELNDKEVTLTKDDLKVSIKWNKMQLILVNSDLICFIPKDVDDLIITVSSKYKDDLLKGIIKYKKENLIRNI